MREILTVDSSGKETRLQSGDVLTFNRADHTISMHRPGAGRLLIGDGDKRHFYGNSDSFTTMVLAISAITGLGFVIQEEGEYSRATFT